MSARHEGITSTGRVDGSGMRVAVVQSRFNRVVTEKLTEGALDALRGCGVNDDAIDVYVVPGAFELPALAKRLNDLGEFDAIICLGVVVRGETPHFDYVCNEAARGIADVAFNGRAAVSFGVLTTDDMPQALARAGGDVGNKGADAVHAALEMATLFRGLES